MKDNPSPELCEEVKKAVETYPFPIWRDERRDLRRLVRETAELADREL